MVQERLLVEHGVGRLFLPGSSLFITSTVGEKGGSAFTFFGTSGMADPGTASSLLSRREKTSKNPLASLGQVNLLPGGL